MIACYLPKRDAAFSAPNRTRPHRRRLRRPHLEALEERELLASWGLDLNFSAEGGVTRGYDTPHLGLATASCGYNSLALQPDGKILVAGSATFVGLKGSDYTVARYTQDGILDTTFGSQGVARVDISDRVDALAKIAVDKNGKIVLAGTTYAKAGAALVSVARLLPNGVIDSSFGSKGVTTVTTTSSNTVAHSIGALAIDSQNRIVIAGGVNSGPPNMVLRFTSSGALDKSFGTNGMVLEQAPMTGTGPDKWRAMQIEGNDSIDLVGVKGGQPTIEHLTSSGKNPTTVTQELPTDLPASYLIGGGGVFTPDGSKVVSAQAANGPETMVVFQNVATSGQLDGNFGTNGETGVNLTEYFTKYSTEYNLPALPEGDSYQARFYVNAGGAFGANAVAFDTSNRILVYGMVNIRDRASTALLQQAAVIFRLDTAGTIDPSFGLGGVVATIFDPGELQFTQNFQAVLVQSDGKILAAGAKVIPSGTSTISNALLARYLPDASVSSGSTSVGASAFAAVGIASEAPRSPVRMASSQVATVVPLAPYATKAVAMPVRLTTPGQSVPRPIAAPVRARVLADAPRVRRWL